MSHLVAAGNDPGTALKRQVCPQPIHGDDQAVAKTDQEIDVRYAPDEPADAAAADAAAKDAGDATAAPAGGLSIADAFRKELGIRLEKQPGTYPAFILDHIEQTPTEN